MAGTKICSQDDTPQKVIEMLKASVILFLVTICEASPVDSSIFKTPNCSLVANGTLYDLSLLRLKSDIPWTAKSALFNPQFHSDGFSEQLFTLNVCGPLPNGKCTEKREQTSVCMQRRYGELLESESLGEFNPNSSLVYDEENKNLKLTYYTKGVVSEISFFCKPGDLNTQPILVNVRNTTDTVVYSFEWETGAACPVTAVIGNDCTVKIKNLGISFNLIPLQKQDYFTIGDDEYDYFINICGEVKGNHCGNNHTKPGACQREKKGQGTAWSLGKANSNLIYENGALKLKYTDGDPYRTKLLRKSEITFVCDHGMSEGNFKFIKETNETYYFEILTKYACPHVTPSVHCSWENETHTYDLSALSVPGVNHVAAGPKGDLFFINVCRALNSISYKQHEVIDCGFGTSICHVIPGESTGLNLGQSLQPPVAHSDGSLTLQFTHGGQCPESKSVNITSLIRFSCNENDIGSPEFREIISNDKECVYIFQWDTKLVCTPEPITSDKSCSFKDSRTGLVADLKTLRKKPKDAHKIHVFHDEKRELSINICDNANSFNSEECSDAAVCLKNEDNTFLSLGKVSEQRVRFDGSSLWFHFPKGSKCNEEENYSSSLEMICDKSAKNMTAPIFKELVECRTHFEWRTDVMCDLRVDHPCTLFKNDRFYDLRVLSSASHAWNVTDPISGDEYWINVCHSLPRSVNCWARNSAVCRCVSGIDCKYDAGDYETQELSVNANNDLVLTYKRGFSPNCTHGVSTDIIFKCGRSRGYPKFVAFTNCVLTFEWSSFVACPFIDSSDEVLEEENGYIYSKLNNASLFVGKLFESSFNVTGVNMRTDDVYSYLINLSNATLPENKSCKHASVCQTKPGFERDIGSVNNFKFVSKNRNIELQILSSNHQKCGKDSKKNVTTIFILECIPEALKKPSFFYESNNCDYIFNWGSSDFCNWISGKVTDASSPDSHVSPNLKEKTSSFVIVILCLLLVCCILFFGIFVLRKERVARIAETVRNTLQPRSSPSFHYSQMSSDTAKLVASEYQTNETLESLAA